MVGNFAMGIQGSFFVTSKLVEFMLIVQVITVAQLSYFTD